MQMPNPTTKDLPHFMGYHYPLNAEDFHEDCNKLSFYKVKYR